MSPERGLALSLFDAILHDPFAPGRPSVGKFRAARTRHVVGDIRRTVATGNNVVIWQIYNMGFVVRTRTVTLGFDLVQLAHVPAIALSDDLAKAIADQCDVLFVSHEHLDHADHKIAQWCHDAGKPVVAPDTMWKGEPIYNALMHLAARQDAQGLVLPVDQGEAMLRVNTYVGAQALKDGTSVQNNVYIVTTPDGFRIAHTGDNHVTQGFPTTANPAPPVDVLVMKFDPGNDMKTNAIVRPFRPRLLLPAHFGEFGHANVNGREPFWRGIERSEKVGVPAVLMAWGERYEYTRPAE